MMIKEYKHSIVTTNPHGTTVFKICESEMLALKKNTYK